MRQITPACSVSPFETPLRPIRLSGLIEIGYSLNSSCVVFTNRIPGEAGWILVVEKENVCP